MPDHLCAQLQEVDCVEILTIIDNYVDLLLPEAEIVTRPPAAVGENILPDTLLAEYGLSLLVTVRRDQVRHTVLFDAGYSRIGVPHNMIHLGVDLQEIEAIVLSHGHMDHTGALYSILEDLSTPVPLVLHPDAFLYPRSFDLDNGKRLVFPKILKRDEPRLQKVNLLECSGPSLITDNTIMVTGEIAGVTDFEKGFPGTKTEKNGKITDDRVLDDQAIVINLKEKGLVVIAGCSHAGIINTALYAQKLTGVDQIHAILGGFHLAGAFFEQYIDPTILELKKIGPNVIVPMHCTGWKAILRLSDTFPDAVVFSCSGARIVLNSNS